MFGATINECIAIIVPIAIGLAGTLYGLAKRVELKEATSLIQSIKEVTHSSSEGGKEITVDEKIRIVDEIIEMLKE